MIDKNESNESMQIDADELRMLRDGVISRDITIDGLRQRVKTFESLETKRMKDAVTAEDWRRIAEYMEYQWRCCSDGFNKRCSELEALIVALKRSQQVAPEQGQSNRYCPVGGNCSDASDCDGSCAPYIGRGQQGEPDGLGLFHNTCHTEMSRSKPANTAKVQTCFSAADMADQGAKAFKEGVASVTT